MTGAYVRIKRKGKWENIEFECLTDKEMEEFAKLRSDDVGWQWAIFFAKYLRDNVKPLMDELVEDGIIKEGLNHE